MRKLLFICAIALALTACTGHSTSSSSSIDSLKVDTTVMVEDSMSTDTIVMDSAMVDSIQ